MMRKSDFIMSIHTGIIAALVCGLVSFIGQIMGLYTVGIWHMAAGILINPEQIFTAKGLIVGLFTHMAIGALWAIVLYILLLFTSKEYSVYKGILFVTFVVIIDMSLVRFGVTSYYSFDTDNVLAIILIHMIYGGVLGWLMHRFVAMGATESGGYIYKLLMNNLKPSYKLIPKQEEDNDYDNIH